MSYVYDIARGKSRDELADLYREKTRMVGELEDRLALAMVVVDAARQCVTDDCDAVIHPVCWADLRQALAAMEEDKP